jgi:hypothetical protein
MNSMKIACLLALSTAAAVTTGPASAASARSRTTAIDGVYRVGWTEKEVIAAGASRLYAHANFGYTHGGQAVITMTLRGGRLQIVSSPPVCHGTYSVSGNRVSIKQGPGCQGVVVAMWSLRSGLLRLHVSKATDPGDEIAWGTKPWRRIGS